MNEEKIEGVIEGILFSAGRVIKIRELIAILEKSSDEIIQTINKMQENYSKDNRGIEIIRVEDGYQLASKKEYYEYIYPILNKQSKPSISQASLEVLSIIAYNPRATRADIDTIRGVDSSASIYRLLEYNLIEQAGKADLPGKPMTYKVTEEFMKTFGLNSLKDLPELPKYKLDSNRQIIIDEIEKENSNEIIDNIELEAPMPSNLENSQNLKEGEEINE